MVKGIINMVSEGAFLILIEFSLRYTYKQPFHDDITTYDQMGLYSYRSYEYNL